MHGMHGIIFSYDKPTALRELIEPRVSGSLPFACDYRIVDFVLSNFVAAGITDVGVILQGKCQSILDHLGTGKSWDLSRNRGGLKLLPAFAYKENMGGDSGFRGRVEALGNILDYLYHIRQDYVVLSDSDLVVNLPLKDVLSEHIASGADMTCVCTSRLGDSNDTYFTLADDGRIVDTVYNIHTPVGHRSLNVFIMGRDWLIRTVEDCIAHNRMSFRGDILQAMGDKCNFRGYCWDGYAAIINSVENYYERSMELLRPEMRAELFDPARPILAKENDAPSSYIDPECAVTNSLISDGCDIQGTVKNSLIFRGVVIEKGAVVEDSILFKGTVVKAGANVKSVIADKNVIIGADVQLQGHPKNPLVLGKDVVVE